MIDVLCVGQLVADILVRPVERVDFGTDTQRVDLIELKNGGDCLNVAIGLRKLGHAVGFVGKIGQDHWGDFLLRVIDQAGIDRRGLKRTGQAGTSAVIVLINQAGERIFFYHGGSNDLFGLEDVDQKLIPEASIVHVGGTFLLPRFDGAGAAALFAEARAQGKLTSMDVTWDTQGRWLKTIEPCLSGLDYFLPSYTEAERITSRSEPEEMAVFLQERGVRNVVIKLGERGCYVKAAGSKGLYVEAFKTRVVDTTGAGDSFVAGFLSGLLRGWEPERSARLACAVAALNIQQVGATAGVPTFEQALSFMEKGRQEND
jgi:sugar/nucleoside kinase (ribokinase family)